MEKEIIFHNEISPEEKEIVLSWIDEEIAGIELEIEKLRRILKGKTNVRKLNDLDLRLKKMKMNQTVLRDGDKKKYRQ